MALEDKAKAVAADIKKVLDDNHVSTVVYGHYFDFVENGDVYDESESFSNIPLLIVVNDFNEDCALKLYKILKKYDKEGIETPYIVEVRDLKGMLDSIPQKIMDIKANYVVLEGEDILELRSEPEFEYMRAHVEMVLRRMIYNFRHDLILVMLTKLDVTKYIKDLSLASLNAIKNFHMLVHPELTTTNEHLDFFYREFPDGRAPLKELLDCVSAAYRGESIKGKDLLELITSVLNKVIQPLLNEVDRMGQDMLEQKMQKIEEIVETKKREMRLELVKEKMDILAQRKEIKQSMEAEKKQLQRRKQELETQIEQDKQSHPQRPPPQPQAQPPPAQAQQDPYYQERYYRSYYQQPYYPPPPPQQPPPEYHPQPQQQAPPQQVPPSQGAPPPSRAPKASAMEVHEEELSAFEKILRENQSLKRTKRVRK